MKESPTSVMLAETVSSLSSSQLLETTSTDAKRGASQISRSYKQASHFFLQRRFPEALLTIQPLITPQKQKDASAGQDYIDGSAPVARASRSNRVKVWSLYLTLLNAIVEIGVDEGKETFGQVSWRAIHTKVRSGVVWEDVVKIGYHNQEGAVDSEVVSNLYVSKHPLAVLPNACSATLLITHSPTQKVTQQRLENYLSASNQPNMDISDRFDYGGHEDASRPRIARGSGTDTPRDLNAKVKVIELYSLHVLPRNGEWNYAKEFITMNEFLDQDTKEEFLLTLQSLDAQRRADQEHEAELLREQEKEIARARRQVEHRTTEEARLAQQRAQGRHTPELHRQQSKSEQDYGIEDSTDTRTLRVNSGVKGTGAASTQRSVPLHKQASRPKEEARGIIGFIGRGTALFSTFKDLILQLTRSLPHRPAVVLRLLVFIAALLVAWGRHDVRDALARMVVAVKRTIGMGVKVSYI
jgi:hypothetical protein